MKSRLPLWVLTLVAIGSSSLAFTPMEHFNSLVAGADEADYRDGSFDEARFDHPMGMVFDATGDKLYIADRDNQRIRVIHLDQQNRVETLAGTGVIGKLDGPATLATFDHPTRLALLPEDRLAIYDAGSSLLRVLDLKSKMVSTLAGSGPKGPPILLWDMVYRPSDGGLYYSETGAGRLQRVEIKTGEVTTVFSGNAQVPFPRALCLFQDKLYVADRDLPSFFQMNLPDKTGTPQTLVSLVAMGGQGQGIMEMAASSNGTLYALQWGKIPLVKLLPNYRPVSLATPWGILMDNENAEEEPFFQLDPNGPANFVVSPQQDRSLYFALLSPTTNSIISAKDLDYDSNWYTEPGRDFAYSEAKPPKTFRILVIGDSRLTTSPVAMNKTDPGYLPETYNLRNNTFPKKMEFWLNAQAALDGVDQHYEVQMLGHWNECPYFFAHYEAPELIKKYDIDLVLMMTSVYYMDYYNKPMTKEGIPAHNLDPEYLLKPWSMRVPPGAPSRFYQHLVKKGFVKEGQPIVLFGNVLHLEDPEIHDDFMEMMGKPLALFADKVKAMKKKDGSAPRMALLYIPWRNIEVPRESVLDRFWHELNQKYGIELVDIEKPFNVLKTSFYPTNQYCCSRHYTAYGHSLIAFLLGRELIADHLIPYEKEKGSEVPEK